VARWLGVIHTLKEARLQNPVPTDRNYIRGLKPWSSKHIIVKAVLQVVLSRCSGYRAKDKCLTWGDPPDVWYIGAKSAEVIVIGGNELSPQG